MLRIRANRPVRLQHALAVCGSLALAACASKYSQVPARLDLAPFGRIALVTFAADQPNSAMGSLATQRFAEALLANQTGVELLELSASDSSLKKLGASVDGVELAKALGKDRNVPAVFVGSLKISNVKPRGHIDASGMNVRAGVSAELTVRLLSTSTGGTVWRSSSVASGTLGGVNISDRLPSIGIRDKDEAYGQMVSQLIAEVTRDLRPTWVKQ
jgi:ribosomal protein S6E (S10)